MVWSPVRSIQQTEALLTSAGSLHEVETLFVDGRLQRVYKNLWPSLRHFWLSAVSQYKEDTYIVYEDQRLTYGQVHARAAKMASMLQNLHNVQKGDRVAICSRNCPDYIAVFWACHLIGAVSVLVNAWLPIEPLSHCLAHTECKVVIVDPERADVLQPAARMLLQKTSINSFLVFDLNQRRKRRNLMSSFDESLEAYDNDGSHIVRSAISILPEDNATIIFTSGTTGLPKGVLSTQRMFLTNALNVLAGGYRAALRKGEDLPSFQRTCPQKAALVNVPLFHVTGSTSYTIMATMTGMKIVMMRKWEVEEGARLIRKENITVAGGVPSMVTDLTMSSLVGHPLEGLLFGGAPAPDTLVQRARKAFPTATLIQGYGLTESNSIAVSFAGEDYAARPRSTGQASPVNDIKIISEGRCMPPNHVGEVWLQGPNIMKCYWADTRATEAAVTKDGWLKTGDIGYLDRDGFLYIKDRAKDIIIRGGENVDSVSVENALYADPRVLEAAAVGVPDERLGELVTAVVSLRPGLTRDEVTEASLIAHAKSRLPRFAVPVMVIILNSPFVRTPSGKIIKNEVRKIARSQWELRQREAACNGNQGSDTMRQSVRANL